MTVTSSAGMVALVCAASACGAGEAPPPLPSPRPPVTSSALLAPAAFASITDRSARSVAMYEEAAKVFTSPRCQNCHPADTSPRQGEASELHDPPVTRGPKDEGVPGAMCTTCHQDANLELARVPGAPKWHLAPTEMAWIGKSAAQICMQIKDPARNGGKSLAQIVDHVSHDALVGWGWHPGSGRAPAPGTQEAFGALVAAWVETGAECPGPAAKEARR
jgi:hypothetical protein